ncbi:hypothetical protein OPQ81_005437 [Rhizoctonia solani]|nr:hypothetical protein OPQ81_005437 [Rhizoctonia solani]
MTIPDELRKLKPDFKSWISSPSSAVSPDSDLEVHAAPILTTDDRGWRNIRILSQQLHFYSGYSVLDPFPKVADGLIDCIELFEMQSDGHKAFKVLQKELDALFKELHEKCLHKILSHTTPSVRSLYKFAYIEVQYLLDRRAKYIKGKDREGGVLACYLRVQNYLQRILINLDVSRWVNKPADSKLPIISGHRSGPRSYNGMSGRGPCIKGTRVEVLEQILSWVDNSSPGSFYWINGMAGTGKTTIAYSLCERLDATHRLAASFFFSRGPHPLGESIWIIRNISEQLAEFSLPFRSVLSGIATTSDLPHLQFEALIAQPLLKVRETLPENIVVVIDSLDEYRDKEIARQILEVLLTKSAGLPIKFIMFSRPEPQILGEAIVQADIKRYLETSLTGLHPSEDQIQALVQKSGVLFFYAAIIVQYLSSKNFKHARTWLAIFLEGENVIEVDKLYTSILQVALKDPTLSEEDEDVIRQVLNVVVHAQEPLGVDSIATLLKLKSTDRVWAALQPLYSVLNISESGEYVAPLHPSFSEYIIDPSRSGEYCCLQEVYGQVMVQRYFRRFRDMQPQFNICGLESPYVPDHRVLGLGERVNKAVSADLFYAARHWAAYLHSSPRSPDLLREWKSSSQHGCYCGWKS